jgi:hypothetical protein
MRHLVIATLGTLALAACGHAESGQGGSAAGPSGQRSYAAADFSSVTLAGPYRVEIRPGAVFAVSASGPQDMLDDLKVEVDGGDLEIGRKSKSDWSFWHRGKPRDGVVVSVTMPRVDGLTLAGSGALSNAAPTGESFRATVAGSGELATGAIAARTVSFKLAGSGDLKGGALDAGETTIDITGSGNVSARGRAGKAQVKVAGSGNIDAAELIASDIDVKILGSGDVTIGATGKATVKTMGSGDVHIRGTHDCIVTKAGSGSVDCG